MVIEFVDFCRCRTFGLVFVNAAPVYDGMTVCSALMQDRLDHSGTLTRKGSARFLAQAPTRAGSVTDHGNASIGDLGNLKSRGYGVRVEAGMAAGYQNIRQAWLRWPRRRWNEAPYR
jgi:hypothetical protein